MTSPRLLDILVCPQCKGKMVPVEGGKGLLCGKCQLKFPVKEGVPVMLVEEAEDMRTGLSPTVVLGKNKETLHSSVAHFRVTVGVDQGVQFELEKGTCRAIGRTMSDPTQTSVLNVDWALSIDSDTKTLILQYIQRQFRQTARSVETKNQIGNFRRASDIVLHDQTLSRLHAMLFFDEAGVGILDLVSKNGTFVNGEEVESRLIKPGDTLELGETKLVFEG